MKYNLEVRYQGQKAIFEGLELDDEQTYDESYRAGVDGNNYTITEHFYENAELTVMRKEEQPSKGSGRTWVQTAGGSKVGLVGSPPENCDVCKKPFFRAAYDAKTKRGPWGWLCPNCFITYGVGLGIGLGQRYQFITREELAKWQKKDKT